MQPSPDPEFAGQHGSREMTDPCSHADALQKATLTIPYDLQGSLVHGAQSPDMLWRFVLFIMNVYTDHVPSHLPPHSHEERTIASDQHAMIVRESFVLGMVIVDHTANAETSIR